MITQFVPGRSYRYIGDSVSPKTLDLYPALSGKPVICLKASGDSAAFDCDISPELMAKYTFDTWEEVESKEEQGFTLKDPYIAKPGVIDAGPLTLWNDSAIIVAEKSYLIQQRTMQKIQEKYPAEGVFSVEGSEILRFTELSIYELLKEGAISITDVLSLATMQGAELAQAFLAECSGTRIEELIKAMKEE